MLFLARSTVGRLVASYSRDGGATWSAVRPTELIEVSAGMDDVERVAPEYPIIPVIAVPDLGQLPDEFAVFRYPNVRVIGDRVFILYAREWFAPAGGATSGFEDERSGEVVLGCEDVLRSYPLQHFYS